MLRYLCTFIIDVDLPTIGLRDATADALHARLDQLLGRLGEGAGGAHNLHVVGYDVVSVAAVDRTTGDYAGLQGILGLRAPEKKAS